MATLSSRGRGETTAVPNWAKLTGVSGSGVSVTVGLAMIGAMIGFWVSRCVLLSRHCVPSYRLTGRKSGEKERSRKRVWRS